ncbi:hypothetical protein FB45DRAFT_933293 [Roridomyces roridus]|uniref:F-box domain-containing protein n=1 Tax=Roridomyces roridus TaxID=1738132 RepID=A0AAD7FFF6_9AGAR|nr:hypothetical protein FB45DRAFT_933293 [Roridomyces roridus]
MHSIAPLKPSGLRSSHLTLLDSNIAPSDSDTILVRSTNSRIDARLVAIDNEISLLETEKASLSVLRAENQAILSPIRIIPPEVWADIFLWTLPPSYEVSPSPRGFSQSPWVLTRVSSLWRQIAVSTPSLWTRIVISYSRGDAWSLEAVKTQIQRARGLRIWFIPSRTLDPAPQLEMFQLLVEQSPRWEEAVLGLTRPMLPAFTAIRDRVPLLHRLWLQWDDDHTKADMNSVDAFRNAPLLRQLCVVEGFTTSIQFPIQQLTHYDLDVPTWMHVRILSAATNLVQARIMGDFTEYTGVPLVPPSLRRAYVASIEIIGLLTTPGLEELRDSDARSARSKSGPFIAALVERSSCPLRRFVVHGAPQDTLIAPILHDLPSIVDLAVVVSIGGYSTQLQANALISALTLSPAPNLDSISFGTDFFDGIDHCLFVIC